MGSNTLRVWRACAYLAWTVSLMPVQALGLLLRRGWVAEFPCFYHRLCCRILGIRVKQIGSPVDDRPVLFVANHTAYLDIAVLGSVIPGSFISKNEIATWPLFGWLAKLQRSVFVDRQVRSTAQQRDAIVERLDAGDALILFPEGTSGDGNLVLPFKSALFSSVFNRRSDAAIAVQPVSVAYTRLDGHAARPFLAAVLRLVRRHGAGAASVARARPRQNRSGCRVSPAGDRGRVRIAQGSRPLLLRARQRRGRTSPRRPR